MMAAEEAADSATVAVGGAVLGVVALFVGGMHLAAQAMGPTLAAPFFTLVTRVVSPRSQEARSSPKAQEAIAREYKTFVKDSKV